MRRRTARAPSVGVARGDNRVPRCPTTDTPVRRSTRSPLRTPGRSWSINSFQAGAAAAYGATGVTWYTWGEGVWNYSGCGSSPDICHWVDGSGPRQPAMDAVTTVNARLLAWGPRLLQYAALTAVYHTGWATVSLSPGSYTQIPGDTIVAAMDTDLMLGLRLPPLAGPPPGGPDAVAVIVDKRVELGAGPPPPARTVTIAFGASIAAATLVGVDVAALAAARAAGVGPDAAAASARTTTHLFRRSAGDAAPVAVNVTLRGGESAMLELVATDAAAFGVTARGMRRLRYDASAVDLTPVRTQVRAPGADRRC